MSRLWVSTLTALYVGMGGFRLPVYAEGVLFTTKGCNAGLWTGA